MCEVLEMLNYRYVVMLMWKVQTRTVLGVLVFWGAARDPLNILERPAEVDQWPDPAHSAQPCRHKSRLSVDSFWMLKKGTFALRSKFCEA